MQNTDDKNIDNEKATNEEALDATVVDSESGKELETETQNGDDKDNISINATDEDLSFKRQVSGRSSPPVPRWRAQRAAVRRRWALPAPWPPPPCVT